MYVKIVELELSIISLTMVDDEELSPYEQCLVREKMRRRRGGRV